ncbi:aminotransferase class III-fold pyridoxal phosphate-dependent enzyme [Halobacteriovorax sp. GB3]|uniref:aminotransferase class III-fold pyridoxal phosphate-dependent enzyme n=1 Tax=Halobacteriovorax sp. GB3 TaxID=2719615 RepID=UPI002360FDF9|nr:aminotransferase class III-fold pyridoxal phosphate-dependent enzyme [Halobacteriovorax sp. GB3]MDD0852699.1 aminotransferase class III-fold pyridoxal phosphate-dependent enzyme [Halobacteriovorax sp. GB3]
MKSINQSDVNHANEKLSKLYENDKVAKEKKTYIADLRNSKGPYFGVESNEGTPHYFMDSASQIATLGLGFNPQSFFGPAHFEQTWTNQCSSKGFEELVQSLHGLFKRELNWQTIHTSFCNSGAEANETALGLAYKNRKNESAKKVLCFEGSFHGRMMVSLMSTWNKTKRAPFEWPGYESVYMPFPEDKSGQTLIKADQSWLKSWEMSASKNFKTPENTNSDPLLESEIQSLLKIRDALKERNIFAILIEPMQCEGGDRYATNRFFQALALIAKSFQVSLIFDEVQTGFHLGRKFFWHTEFELQDSKGQELFPDYVVLAKKAQSGIVLSPIDKRNNEEIAVSSIARGHAHALMISQNDQRILELENLTDALLLNFKNKYSDFVENPRVHGLAFAIDLKNQEHVGQFIQKRFDHAQLFYPAGSNTLRFRLNTSFRKEDLDFLFACLENIAESVFHQKELAPVEIPTFTSRANDLYFWQELFLEARLAPNNKENTLRTAKEWIEQKTESVLVKINRANFLEFKEKIIDLEKTVYEPARQTEIEKFEATANHENSQCYALMKNDKLQAITFAGPLSLYPYERGVRRDPSFANENTLYMLDTTTAPNSQGLGIGRDLKSFLVLNSIFNGIESINGRNRDHLAKGMLSINLSLGAKVIDYINEDYPDDEEYRDVFYYKGTASWKEQPIELSNGVQSRLTLSQLSTDFCKNQLPYLVNKVCLSNFISSRFIQDVKDLTESFPKELQHVYTASGQSECVDKLSRSLWFNQKENEKSNKLLTFKGHYFGKGSFLSRSLSESDEFFDTTKLTCPTTSETASLKELESILKKERFMGLWLEPIQQRNGKKISRETLEKIITLCNKYKTPVIFNETASSMYRYSKEQFLCANQLKLQPDALMCYLSGQAAICAMKKDYFIDAPLMVISTWDGDEFSFNNYLFEKQLIENNKRDYDNTLAEFDQAIKTIAGDHSINEFHIENGVGLINGPLSYVYSKYFKQDRSGQFLVLASYGQMKRFLSKYNRGDI